MLATWYSHRAHTTDLRRKKNIDRVGVAYNMPAPSYACIGASSELI